MKVWFIRNVTVSCFVHLIFMTVYLPSKRASCSLLSVSTCSTCFRTLRKGAWLRTEQRSYRISSWLCSQRSVLRPQSPSSLSFNSQCKTYFLFQQKLHLENYMLYAHGPDLCHESDLKHAMANCFEALLGIVV